MREGARQQSSHPKESTNKGMPLCLLRQVALPLSAAVKQPRATHVPACLAWTTSALMSTSPNTACLMWRMLRPEKAAVVMLVGRVHDNQSQPLN